jgi:hypothetical protein
MMLDPPTAGDDIRDANGLWKYFSSSKTLSRDLEISFATKWTMKKPDFNVNKLFYFSALLPINENLKII